MKAFTRFFKLFNRGLSVALILCLFCLATALAASGGLDTTFSGDGKLTLDLAAGKSGKARMAAVQSDGKIVVVGDVTRGTLDLGLARLKPAGILDKTFNTTGKVIKDLGKGEQGVGLAIDPATGKIVVDAQICDDEACDLLVLRYNTNGSLDTSFNGTGYRIVDYGSGDNGSFGAITIQSDGKVLVSGYMFNSTNNNYDMAIYRFTTKGALDTTFNGSGKKALAFGSGRQDMANAILVQPNGKILVAGTTQDVSFGNGNFAIARLNANGSLDTTFNSTGKQTTNLGGNDTVGISGMAIQSDGKIILGGSKDTGTVQLFALVRYTSTGKLDKAFNGTGKKVFDFSGSGVTNWISSVAFQAADKKILACGLSNDDFALVRLNVNGSLDKTFNSTGKVTIDFGGADICRSVVIQPADGKYVLTGTYNDGSAFHWALARILP